MAKDFGKAGVNKKIEEAKKKSATQANIISIKWIDDKDLLDYQDNNEDITTTDLELSMKELGFTDPIEITDFYTKENENKYTILSGHRRRYAWRKVSNSALPCLIRHFDSEEQLKNYVLMSNSQRDSAKDPLLFCKRYKMHEEFLNETGFKGSVSEEVAKRLGLSVQQADRYKQFNRIILPVWDMVRNDEVGMSSVLKMAKHPADQQEEILTMLIQAKEAGQRLSREVCNKIISAYREGKRSWLEVTQGNFGSYITAGQNQDNSENGSPENDNPFPRNNEINYDYSHREDYADLGITKDPYAEERLTEEDYKAIELAAKQGEEQEEEVKEVKGHSDKKDKKVMTEDEKKLKAGEDIEKYISKLEVLLNDFYTFVNVEQADNVINNMSALIKLMVSEMDSLSDKYKLEKSFTKALEDLESDLQNYNNND